MKLSAIKYCFLVGLVLYVLTAEAQTRKQLEDSKKKAEKEIAFTKKILSQTSKEKSSNLHSLNVLKNLIQAREKLIHTLNLQIKQIEEDLFKTQEVLHTLEAKLEHEKDNYAKLLVNTYKSRSKYSDLSFIFSSESFFQVINRIRFLKLINREQTRLITSIHVHKGLIEKRIEELALYKLEQEQVLQERLKEREKLEGDRSKKNELVIQLSGKEEELKAKLRQQQLAAEDLDRQIKKAIAKEMEAARKRKEAESKKGKSDITLTPEASELSKEFAGNKRKLPWPVEKGFIGQQFGKMAHPTLSGIYTENNGVDIVTEPGSKARVVFRGEVSAIFPVPGMGMAVLVNHGEYYTVYAKLQEVWVKRGQTLDMKDIIGPIMTDESGKSELHFEVWKNQDKQDPILWLSGR
jgi:murein hydrolase activator